MVTISALHPAAPEPTIALTEGPYNAVSRIDQTMVEISILERRIIKPM